MLQSELSRFKIHTIVVAEVIKRGDAYGLVGVQTGQMCVGNNLMTRNELIRGLFHKTITFTHCTGEFWLLTGALQVAAMLLERSTNE